MLLWGLVYSTSKNSCNTVFYIRKLCNFVKGTSFNCTIGNRHGLIGWIPVKPISCIMLSNSDLVRRPGFCQPWFSQKSNAWLYCIVLLDRRKQDQSSVVVVVVLVEVVVVLVAVVLVVVVVVVARIFSGSENESKCTVNALLLHSSSGKGQNWKITTIYCWASNINLSQVAPSWTLYSHQAIFLYSPSYSFYA